MDRIDIETAGSPGWWLNVLLTQLHNRRTGRSGAQRWTRNQVQSARVRPPLDLLDDYLRGDPPLREDIHTGWAAPFRQFVRMGRLNFADLLVSVTGNRMGIRDFRTAAANDELGDEAARAVMRRNNLKLVARDVHDYMLGLGDGYTMVTPPDAAGPRNWSLITAESPLHCITAHDPATGATLAGLKVFHDDLTESQSAYLFLPGELLVAAAPGMAGIGGRGAFRFAKDWAWQPDRFDTIPGGVVPLVRFRNRRGVGEFEHHLDHLDRINDKVFNEWWISKVQAFRQRALERDPAVTEGDWDEVAGLGPDAAPHTVEDTLQRMFVSSPDAMWDLPPGAKIWESQNVSVEPLVNSIQKELQWLAAAAQKPLATLNPDTANQSAEGSSNQKEEHLYAVEDRRDRAEGGWAQTMSLAFLFQGDDLRADVTQIEPIWGPIERFSLAQKADAGQKATGTLPRDAIQRDIWQYSPAEIPQLRLMAGRDLLAAPAAGP